MKKTLAKLDLHLTPNASAVRRCEAALECKDKGDYDGAREAVEPFWKQLGERPNTEGLHPEVVAQILLTVGILTRWIGSKNQSKAAQETARDLISEATTFYESVGDVRKVAEAQTELAYCYWREGSFDNARVMFTAALEKLPTEGNTRANALLGLSVVEWSASRYSKALEILTENASLFKKVTNHTTRGTYHNQLAMVLRKLATPENRVNQSKQAIREYEQADHHFKLARNTVFRANVLNNVGNILRELSRLNAAHRYLEEARRLAVSVRDKILVAQFDDSRARLLLAQNLPAEAEQITRGTVRVLERSGHVSLLADLLLTHGTALARLHKTDQAQFTFQRAIEVALQVDALNKAGMAALTMIEEIERLSPDVLSHAYEQAGEWLADCQSHDLLLRFKAAGKKLALELRSATKTGNATQLLFNQPCNMSEEMLAFERSLIRGALAKVDGRISHAASLLSIGRQRLAYILETRHKDLLNERTPIHRRARKGQ